jgi:hypothetical protein
VGTDSRRLFTGSFWAQFQRLADGVQVQGSCSIMMRPLSRLELELAPSTLYTNGEPRFIEKEANNFYEFGRLRAMCLTCSGAASWNSLRSSPRTELSLRGRTGRASETTGRLHSIAPPAPLLTARSRWSSSGCQWRVRGTVGSRRAGPGP